MHDWAEWPGQDFQDTVQLPTPSHPSPWIRDILLHTCLQHAKVCRNIVWCWDEVTCCAANTDTTKAAWHSTWTFALSCPLAETSYLHTAWHRCSHRNSRALISLIYERFPFPASQSHGNTNPLDDLVALWHTSRLHEPAADRQITTALIHSFVSTDESCLLGVNSDPPSWSPLLALQPIVLLKGMFGEISLDHLPSGNFWGGRGCHHSPSIFLPPNPSIKEMGISHHLMQVEQAAVHPDQPLTVWYVMLWCTWYLQVLHLLLFPVCSYYSLVATDMADRPQQVLKEY